MSQQTNNAAKQPRPRDVESRQQQHGVVLLPFSRAAGDTICTHASRERGAAEENDTARASRWPGAGI